MVTLGLVTVSVGRHDSQDGQGFEVDLTLDEAFRLSDLIAQTAASARP